MTLDEFREITELCFEFENYINQAQELHLDFIESPLSTCSLSIFLVANSFFVPFFVVKNTSPNAPFPKLFSKV